MFELIWYHQQTLPSVTVKSLRFSKNLYVRPHGPWPTHLCRHVKTKEMYVCENGNAKACTCAKNVSILNVNMICMFEYSCICKYEYFNIWTLYACKYVSGSCEGFLREKHYHQRLLKWWLPWKTLIKDCRTDGCLQRLSSRKTVIKDCCSDGCHQKMLSKTVEVMAVLKDCHQRLPK